METFHCRVMSATRAYSVINGNFKGDADIFTIQFILLRET